MSAKEKRLNIRVEKYLIDSLNELAKIESIDTGMKFSQSNIIRKALKEFVDNNRCKLKK
jgi:hypothetical protein